MRRALAVLVLVVPALAAALFWPSPDAEGLIPEDGVIVAAGAEAELSFTIRSVRDQTARIAGISAADGPVRIEKGAAHGEHGGHAGHGQAAQAQAWIAQAGKAALAVPAGGSRAFPPPGARLVLPATTALAEGAVIPVAVDFGEAGTLTLSVRVEAAPSAMEGMDHGRETPLHEPAAGEPRPALSIAASPDIDGGWTLAVHVVDFGFAPDAVDGAHVPGRGHGHLYVNDLKIGRVFGEVHRLPPLLPGPNTIRVELNTNDHRLYAVDGAPVAQEITVQQVE